MKVKVRESYIKVTPHPCQFRQKEPIFVGPIHPRLLVALAMKRTILLLGLWVIVTPIWILFCFYSGAGEDSVHHTSSSDPETTLVMAFTPPALVLIGLAIWMCFGAFNQLLKRSTRD
jgi:hypothetical protein